MTLHYVYAFNEITGQQKMYDILFHRGLNGSGYRQCVGRDPYTGAGWQFLCSAAKDVVWKNV